MRRALVVGAVLAWAALLAAQVTVKRSVAGGGGAVTLTTPLWLPAPWPPATPTVVNQIQLDASAEKAAFVFWAPRDGTIDTVEFGTLTVSNNPDNGLRVSLQDVDLATGNPDGTQDQFRTVTGTFASNTWVEPGLLTSDGTDGGAKRTVTKGDLLAVVIEFESFVAGDSIQVAGSFANAQAIGYQNAYPKTFVSSWGNVAVSGPIFALKYETDGYVMVDDGVLPVMSRGGVTYGPANSPDEYALRFQLPYAATLDAAWLWFTHGTADYVVTLYDATDQTLATVTVDATPLHSGSTARHVVHFSPLTLSANTTYRLSLTSTGGNVAVQWFEAPNNDVLAGTAGGAEWYLSTRTDGGAWTDVTDTRPFFGLRLTSVGGS